MKLKMKKGEQRGSPHSTTIPNGVKCRSTKEDAILATSTVKPISAVIVNRTQIKAVKSQDNDSLQQEG